MKRAPYVHLALAALCVVALLTAVQVVNAQTVIGTDHDISNNGCASCHQPHKAMSAGPLWAQTLTTQTFTLYGSDTLDSTPGQPVGVSKLCLSCHDGVTTIDAGTGAMTGGKAIGTDLSGSHPISMTYDTALATLDGGLHDPAATTSGLGGNIDADMLYGAANDQLECGSCHDPHDNTNTKFLIKSNAGSALCITCHDK